MNSQKCFRLHLSSTKSSGSLPLKQNKSNQNKTKPAPWNLGVEIMSAPLHNELSLQPHQSVRPPPILHVTR